MKYKTYSDYKDSGVEWMGEIPEEWNVTKTAYFYKSAMGQTILQEDLEGDGEYPIYSATAEDKYFGYISNPTVLLNKGDLVIPARGNSIGYVKLVKEKSTTTQTTIYCKALSNKNYDKYIYYYMLGNKSNLFYFVQTAIPQITVSEVLTNPLVLPPLQEQQQIANFLDNATSKIDTLIEKQTKLIELLKEKRQAVISHAVTKGLDPNVPMKDSGVEWLGEIPEHWEIKKLKYLCFITTGSKDTENKVDDGEYPFFVRSQIIERINSYSYNGEAILTAGDGAGVGKVFHYTNGKFDFHQRVYMFYKFNKHILGKYLFEYIKNQFYKVALEGGAKSTVDSLRLPLIQNFIITCPSTEEQEQIVNYLDDKTSKIDTLIEKSNKAIELLKEKRTALISSAVTGKIDVRDIA